MPDTRIINQYREGLRQLFAREGKGIVKPGPMARRVTQLAAEKLYDEGLTSHSEIARRLGRSRERIRQVLGPARPTKGRRSALLDAQSLLLALAGSADPGLAEPAAAAVEAIEDVLEALP